MIWPDGPEKQLVRLKAACPRLVINAKQKMFASTAPIKLPVEADMRRPLDADYAVLVSQLPIDETSKHSDTLPAPSCAPLP